MNSRVKTVCRRSQNKKRRKKSKGKKATLDYRRRRYSTNLAMPPSSQAPPASRHMPTSGQRRLPFAERRCSSRVALHPRRTAPAPTRANPYPSPPPSSPTAAAAAAPSPSPSAPAPARWSSSWPEWRPDPIPSRRPTVALLDLRSLGPIPYEAAWDLQKRLVDALLAERQRAAAAEEQVSPPCSSSCSSPPSSSSSSRRHRRPAGALILLQHEPVYTLGAGATTANLRFDPGRAFLDREGEGGGREAAAARGGGERS